MTEIKEQIARLNVEKLSAEVRLADVDMSDRRQDIRASRRLLDDITHIQNEINRLTASLLALEYRSQAERLGVSESYLRELTKSFGPQ